VLAPPAPRCPPSSGTASTSPWSSAPHPRRGRRGRPPDARDRASVAWSASRASRSPRALGDRAAARRRRLRRAAGRAADAPRDRAAGGGAAWPRPCCEVASRRGERVACARVDGALRIERRGRPLIAGGVIGAWLPPPMADGDPTRGPGVRAPASLRTLRALRPHRPRRHGGDLPRARHHPDGRLAARGGEAGAQPLLRGPVLRGMLVSEAKLAARLSHATSCRPSTSAARRAALHRDGVRRGLRPHAAPEEAVAAKIGLPAEYGFYIVLEMLQALDYAHRCSDDEGNAARHRAPRRVALQRADLARGRGEALRLRHRARADDLAELPEGALEGKAAYMSPEHARGERSTAAPTSSPRA
jgi:hypothetical protein